MIKPALYKVGKYYYDDAKNKRNGELDVVTLDKYGYTFYEVKFTKSPIDDAVVNEEKTQLSKAGISYNRLGFISKSGFRIDDNENYIVISIEDMYK